MGIFEILTEAKLKKAIASSNQMIFDIMSKTLSPDDVQVLLDKARGQVEYNVVDFTIEILALKLRDQNEAKEGDVL